MEQYLKIREAMNKIITKMKSGENTKSNMDKYFDLRAQLFIVADMYKLHPKDITDSWTIADTVDSGQYHTQGLGATKYAKGHIKLSQLKFQQLGIPSKIEESSWCYNQRNWGGQFNINRHTTFTLFVKCSEDLAELVLLRPINKPDCIKWCEDNQVNPLVY